jgi:hypothetical protein
MNRTIILALSLAVVLVAATASTAGTSPTTTAPPLTLDVGACSAKGPPAAGVFQCYPEDRKLPIMLQKKLELHATVSNDSTLVVSGSVKKTTKRVTGGSGTIEVRLKHAKRLNKEAGGANPSERHPKVKINVTATDDFGQTATDAVKLRVRRNPLL